MPAAPPCLILAALKPEARVLARAMKLVPDGPLWVGAAPSGPLVLGVMGMGPKVAVSAAMHFMDVFGPQEVIVAGFCAGLTEALRAGDVIEPAEVIDARSGERFVLAGGRGCLVSVEKIAGSVAEKQVLRKTWNADALDMETAAVAALCVNRRVPWRAVRAVSDDYKSEIPPDLAGQIGPDGEVHGMAGYLVRHPQRLPALLKLGLGSGKAGRALGQAVRCLVKSRQPV